VVWILWYTDDDGDVVIARVYDDKDRAMEDLDLVDEVDGTYHVDTTLLYITNGDAFRE
jgi:hypothetical protein